jgi:hypothetical protein
MSEKIYVVTHGQYSDYRILTVCSTRELAERALKMLQVDAKIEEFDLDAVMQVRPGYRPYSVYMARDGESRIDEGDAWERDAPGKFTTHVEILGNNLIYLEVWAKDADHAVKIANEKRIQTIANGEWPES